MTTRPPSSLPSPATYVYCVVHSSRPPAVGKAPEGLPGTGPARALGLGEGIWAVVADAPLPHYGAEEIERRLSDLSWVSACAVAHEAVVEHFAGRGPILPMKLFTLFASDQRTVADLGGRREELERVLERVAGHVEWGLRIRFDAARARRRAEGDGAPPATGTDFLLRKKRERESARQLAGGGAEAANSAFAALALRSKDARRRDLAGAPPDSGLLLDAAFLVPAGAAADFEKAVGAEAERLAERACEVTLTGPWPPYNFIDVEETVERGSEER